MRTIQKDTSWVIAAVRRREAELADACATAAVHMHDTVVARQLAELVFEHLRHARPQCECGRPLSADVDAATLRSRAQRTYAQPDVDLTRAIDDAVVGAIARAHAELALFIDDACGSLLVAPFERERLLRIAFCTAALGESVDQRE